MVDLDAEGYNNSADHRHLILKSIEECNFPEENFLSKQIVKEAIIKGLTVLISPECEKPYGDTCGYCTSCKRYQQKISDRILKELNE